MQERSGVVLYSFIMYICPRTVLFIAVLGAAGAWRLVLLATAALWGFCLPD